MSGEEAVFDPKKPVQPTPLTAYRMAEEALRMLGDINRNLIAIEAAILGADNVTVNATINDEPF